ISAPRNRFGNRVFSEPSAFPRFLTPRNSSTAFPTVGTNAPECHFRIENGNPQSKINDWPINSAALTDTGSWRAFRWRTPDPEHAAFRTREPGKNMYDVLFAATTRDRPAVIVP